MLVPQIVLLRMLQQSEIYEPNLFLYNTVLANTNVSLVYTFPISRLHQFFFNRRL